MCIVCKLEKLQTNSTKTVLVCTKSEDLTSGQPYNSLLSRTPNHHKNIAAKMQPPMG